MPLPALSDLQLWFLTGSQSLYGEETLHAVDAQSRQVAAGLDGAQAVPIPVVHRPVLTTPEAIRRACLEASADDRCAGVIAWMHTFSPAKMWIAGLEALAVPLLHLHTQFNASLPWSEIDMDFMNLNQSAHGDREFGHIHARLGLGAKVIAGHWADPEVQARVGGWARAAAGAHEARHLQVIRFGDNMREVAVTEGDKVEAQRRFGFSVNTYGPSELSAVVDATADGEVDALVAEYEERYDVAEELRRGGERHAALREAARLEAGLRTFLTEHGAGAFTDTFEDLAGLRQLPGIAVQRLMADGYGFGGEGDWKTSALLRIVKTMAAGLPGGTSFMEDYTYHWSPGTPQLLGAHMLEICPSIAAARPRCEIHPLSIGDREDPVRLVFDTAPGPGVVLGILDLGPRFRLVANTIDVVAAAHELPRLPVARAVWEPHPDLRTAAEGWLICGGPHHTVFSEAVTVEMLDDLAEIFATELVVIDRSTTIRGLRQELRATGAYQHLARGL
jgi:L-arabinose isomerase